LIRQRRAPRSTISIFTSAIFLLSIGFGISARTQTAPQTTDTAITELVESIAQPLKKANAKKVIVFGFTGPNKQPHPVGKWLTDQVCVTIRKEFPKIEAIDQSELSPNSGVPSSSVDAEAIFNAQIHQARALGAGVIINGSFAKVSDQLGVSLSIANMADLGKTQEVRTRFVPLSKEIIELTPKPIPELELHDGVPRGGEGGISMPICTHCPPPSLPQNAKVGGIVLVELVVTPEGRADRIKIIKSPSAELADSAVRTVQNWRFKPAIGFDGSPIAVFTGIQLSFH
jgi:TonB family protein